MGLKPETLIDGPRVVQVLRDPSARWVLGLWLVAWLGAIVTLSMSIPHLLKILAAPPSKQRRYFLSIVPMPIIFAVTAAISVIATRTNVVWQSIQHVAEAIALHSLNKLMIVRMGGMEVAADHFRQQGAQRYFQVPPVCCCLFCIPPVVLGPCPLRFIRLLTRQFLLLVPILGIVLVIMAYANLDQPYFQVTILLRLVMFLSAFTALYGLFVMWRATRQELIHFHTTMKFATLKVIILIGLIQYYGLQQAADAGMLHGSTPTHLYSPRAWAIVINNVLLAIESPLLYVFVRIAFPAEEIMNVMDDDDEDGGAKRRLDVSGDGGGGGWEEKYNGSYQQGGGAYREHTLRRELSV